MAAINCPNCRELVALDESLAGGSLNCPSCGAQFSVPPIADPFDSLAEFNPYSRALKRRFERPTSIWDLFDFKFEKYLTPWIIRATWVVVCLLAAFYFALWAISSIADAVDRNEISTKKVATKSVETDEVEFEWSFGGTRFTDISERIAFFVFRVVGIVFALLWIRVALETEIVIFNIAMGITSIDRKLKGKQ
jgi:hypothetical protein